MIRVLLLLFKRRHKTPFHHNNLKVVIIFIALIWYSTAGYLYFEMPKKPDLGWGDALWWTMVTMATVGYGDLFPVTAGGRYLIGIPTMVFGIGFLGFIISETASRLIESRSRRLRGLSEVSMNNHILIVNYTSLDEIIYLVDELRADVLTREKQICLIDEHLDEIPHKLIDYGLQFVKGNPTDDTVLERAHVKTASHLIMLSRDRSDPHADDQNLATTLVMEKMNPAIHSVVEVLDPRKIHQIELAGADSAVCMSGFRANLIIQELQDPGVKTIVQDLTSNAVGNQFYIMPIETAGGPTYRDLVLWGLDHGYAVIGVMRDGQSRMNCPSADPLAAGDRAILVGCERPAAVRL